MDWRDALAFDLYQAIARHGWALVAALWPLHLTDHDADALFCRIDWLTTYFPVLLAQWHGVPQEKESATHGYHD